MNCRTALAVNCGTKLGFNQHDLLMTQEPSILSKIETLFGTEKIML